MQFKSTEEIRISDETVRQVVGQDEAVELIKIAAKQRRFVLLIGDPGTGKSMLGGALAENMKAEESRISLLFHNPEDRNQVRVKAFSSEKAEREFAKWGRISREKNRINSLLFVSVLLMVAVSTAVFTYRYDQPTIVFWGLLVVFGVIFLRNKVFPNNPSLIPKVLFPPMRDKVPFIDATGFHEGGLLGDVRHDPYQSGGSESLPYQLVEAGAIHRANKGVLYIDEVSTLNMESQLSLLTAIQNKELPITGRSPGSSGTMVQTDPVECDFVLIIAGHKQDLEGLHSAMRSRMRGYGYEIYTRSFMPDTWENREGIVRFVAQEVVNDGKIPHFSYEAVQEIIKAAGEMSPEENSLSCRFRELGGLVRAAGDQAMMNDHDLVELSDVIQAKKTHLPIEKQVGV
jgi:Lon-like ATP-dependent protease